MMFGDVKIVFRKEFNAYFRNKMIFLLMFVYTTISWGVFFYASDAMVNTTENLYQFFYVQPFLMMFTIPAITMRIWADEYKNNTLEITLSLPVKLSAIIVGKFLAVWSVAGLMLAVSVPGWIVLANILELANFWILLNYVSLFLVGGSLCALGLMAASICYNALGAFLIGMALCLSVVWLPIGKWLIYFMPENMPLIGFVNMFGFMEQYLILVSGQINMASVLLFVLIVSFALIVSDVVVKYKRN